ncbi:MAG: S1 RNA-binding domain-containing protein [Velocimicrobium sp.]
MIRLGETQDLKVIEFSNSGIYLATLEDESHENRPSWQPEKSQKVLLPNNQVPSGVAIDDILSVFIYKDSEDRPIATTIKPLLQLNGLAKLNVLEVGKIGAFLDWGLAKDLLLPFKEQTRRVNPGETILVTLYIDKSERLCATMNVYKALLSDSPYQMNDSVTGTVYEPSGNFGVFVAVDDIYSAIIPKKDVFREYTAGEVIEARVTNVREDGKLNLSTREKIPVQINADADLVYDKLLENDDFLPYNDSSDPVEIRQYFCLSKNAFKRAIGHLLKDGKITIHEEGIRKK